MIEFKQIIGRGTRLDDALMQLGNAAAIRDAFVGFQQYLYSDRKWMDAVDHDVGLYGDGALN